VFLPRPLIIVERLPRNATGKLPHQELQSLANCHLQTNDTP
jgi:acyl-coenzyme A synthetase/AMP-(fatty) acid ligase